MSDANIYRLYEIWVSYDTDLDGEMWVEYNMLSPLLLMNPPNINIYYTYCLTRSQEEFLAIPEIAASPLKERLLLLLNMASTETGSNKVTFNAFAILLSVMSIDGPLDKKMLYAFRMIDIDNDGKIDRKDLLEYMKLITKFDDNQVPPETQEEYLQYSVASTLNECSQNGLFISLEDFQKSMYGCDDFAQRFTLNIRRKKKDKKNGTGKDNERKQKSDDYEDDKLKVQDKTPPQEENELVSSPSKFQFKQLAKKANAMNKAFR